MSHNQTSVAPNEPRGFSYYLGFVQSKTRAEDEKHKLSHNQNPVLKCSTQNHVQKWEGGYPQLVVVGIVPY